MGGEEEEVEEEDKGEEEEAKPKPKPRELHCSPTTSMLFALCISLWYGGSDYDTGVQVSQRRHPAKGQRRDRRNLACSKGLDLKIVKRVSKGHLLNIYIIQTTEYKE